MPWEGKNPLEFGGSIIDEAARRYDARDGFLDDAFLGHGTRTASLGDVSIRRATARCPSGSCFASTVVSPIGETPEKALADVEGLPAVAAARKAGLKVEVTRAHL